MKLKQRIKSDELYKKCCKVIPSGVNSPIRAFSQIGICPLIIESGKNDLIFDIDGNSYIDFCGSWGSLIFGHSPDFVVKEIIDQVKKGTSFGTINPFEEKIANLIVSVYKSIEKIRFVSSGTEATMTAIRIARGYTKKKYVVKFSGNYHGHNDSLLVEAGSSANYLQANATSLGIPSEVTSQTISLNYNDLDQLENFSKSDKSNHVAAVIIEPIAGNMGLVPAKKSFLDKLKTFCINKGSLLIFDEVITGFRVSLRGAQGIYGIEPDITCFGKIIGGGFPAAAIGASKKVMDVLAPNGGVFQAGTLSGNPVAMRAGYATLKALLLNGVYEKIEEKANFLLEPIHSYIRKNDLPVVVNQVGSMFSIFFGLKSVNSKNDLKNLDLGTFKKFFLFMLNNGIYITQSPYESNFVSLVHTKNNLLKTKTTILQFLKSSYE